MIPAIILRVFEFSNNIFPIKDAVAPKVINTSEKPKENKTVFKIIFFCFSTL